MFPYTFSCARSLNRLYHPLLMERREAANINPPAQPRFLLQQKQQICAFVKEEL